MITVEGFPEYIRKYNSDEVLQDVVDKVNRGEGYCDLLFGKYPICRKFLTGNLKFHRDVDLYGREVAEKIRLEHKIIKSGQKSKS